MEIKYYIDGVDILTYDVHVSDSDGLLSQPKMKAPLSLDWANYHGEQVALQKKFYDSRTIKLECFVRATSTTDFITKCNSFQALFTKPWTSRLTVLAGPNVPLVYEVYAPEGIEVKKQWNESLMVGTFTLTLKEPEPIKKVLSYTRTSVADKTVSITLTSTKFLNIYWGDGAHTFDVSGTAQTITHDFATNGVFYIVITGNIDDITSLTTTGTVIWAKL